MGNLSPIVALFVNSAQKNHKFLVYFYGYYIIYY